jgi:hypothetical protein
LDPEHRVELAGMLKTIAEHFRVLSGTPSLRFAMEVEFKVTSDGALIVKQARLWVE